MKLTSSGRLSGSEIQLDQLFMKVRSSLSESVNDMLEVIDTRVRPDLVEVSHNGVAR